jgi:predicted small secreted protein
MKTRQRQEAGMKKFWVMLAVLGALLSTTACNTVRGVGEDIEDVGDAVKDATN